MNYIVVFTPRCGSTLLCNLLAENGMGYPGEFFQEPLGITNKRFYDLLSVECNDFRGFIDKLKERFTNNNIFGVKLAWRHRAAILSEIRKSNMVDAGLETLFPDSKWIFIHRKDKVAQAVSLWRAIKSDKWHSPDASNGNDYPEYDYFKISMVLANILRDEYFWNSYFTDNKIPFLDIEYTVLAGNPSETILKVAEYLHYPLLKENFRNKSGIVKLADSYSIEMIAKFNADYEHASPMADPAYWSNRTDQWAKWLEFYEKEPWHNGNSAPSRPAIG